MMLLIIGGTLQQERLLAEVELEEEHHDDADASRQRTWSRLAIMGAVPSASRHSLRLYEHAAIATLDDLREP